MVFKNSDQKRVSKLYRRFCEIGQYNSQFYTYTAENIKDEDFKYTKTKEFIQ